KDRGDRAPTPRRVPRDVQGLVGRGEDGRVHGGEAEASVPRTAPGEGLGDRDVVSRRGRDRAPGGGDPGVPAPPAVGRGERPRGADRDVKGSWRAPTFSGKSETTERARFARRPPVLPQDLVEHRIDSSNRNAHPVGGGWILPWSAVGKSSRSLGGARPRFRSSFASVMGLRKEVDSSWKTGAIQSSSDLSLASRTSAVPCRKRRGWNGC